MKRSILDKVVKAFLKSTATYKRNSQNEVITVLNEEALAAGKIIKLMSIGMGLASTKSVLFKTKGQNKNSTKITDSALGIDIINILLNVDFDDLRNHFPKHVFNPMLDRIFSMIEGAELVEKTRSPRWRNDSVGEQELVDGLNSFVDAFRAEVNGNVFKAKLKNYLRKSRKNERQLRGLIDAVFGANPKVMVIRIDLSYKEHHESMHGYEKELTLADVRDHRQKLLKQIDKKFNDSLITYAWKLEVGLKKGYHHHFLFFLDGTKLRQDVVIGKIIGETWEGFATEGLGQYYNCNGNKENYKDLCVGVFQRGDIEIIRLLKDVVATYMAKVDFFMKFDSSTGFRSFGKGAIPKQKIKKIKHSEIPNRNIDQSNLQR